jgi:hypothetical protein
MRPHGVTGSSSDGDISESGGDSGDKVRLHTPLARVQLRFTRREFPELAAQKRFQNLTNTAPQDDGDDYGELTLNVTVSGAHTSQVTCAIAHMIKSVPAKILDVEIVVVARRLTAIATLVADSSKKAHDSIARVHSILTPLHVDIAIDCVSGAWLSSPLLEGQSQQVAPSSSASSSPLDLLTTPSSPLSTALSSTATATKATLVITAIKEVGVPVAFIADVLQVITTTTCSKVVSSHIRITTNAVS